MMSRTFFACVCLIVVLVPVTAVQAQDYPAKPVHIIVPFSPGGPADATARIVANALQQELGEPFVVENRPGASGTVGAAAVARSAPDGYTLLLTNIADTWNQFLNDSLPYDYIKDFSPISLIMSTYFMLIGNADLPASNFDQLLQLARSKPGSLTYGSAGFGVSSHLAGELLAQMAGIDIRHIPYKGQGPALTDLLGGHNSFMFVNPVIATPYIKAGKLHALATTGREREPPGDVLTIAESGVPGFEVDTWFGLSAPAGTPKHIIDLLAQHVVKVLKDPKIRGDIELLGAQPIGNTPEEFRQRIQSDMTKWGKVVANIHLER
ncbi:tripartite tricarboxylate transporter substrate binding protein [Bordetella petrii]|nr:tripartite tricarboxylate transporter substrate binding protein [Bordetella petrii]